MIPRIGRRDLPRVLDSAFDNAPIGMAVLTPDGTVTMVNPAMGALLGVPPDDLIGHTFFEVTHPDDLPAAQYNCGLLQSGGPRILRHECRFLRADGSVVWVSVSTSRVPEVAGRPAHLIMHIEDVSERKELEERLTHQASHDPLTGLANRTLLAERIEEALHGPHRFRPHCLLYVDLDGFKGVNDRFGHTAGDAVLQQLAARITPLLREQDTAARLGGDEFAVLCVGVGARHGDAVAERLRAAAARPFSVDGHEIRLSAAVGVSSTEHDDPAARPGGPVDLLRRADEHMYEAKRSAGSDGRLHRSS